jgi:hypothetical protein
MTIFNQIGLAPEKGGRVKLRRFGTFTIKRDGRTVHNPRKGAAVVDAKVLPLFKACRELRAPAPQPDCGHFRKRALCGNVAANRSDGLGMAPDQITAWRVAASALTTTTAAALVPPVGLRLLLDDAETAPDAVTPALDPSKPPGMRKQSSSATTTDTAGSLALRERVRQVRTERGLSNAQLTAALGAASTALSAALATRRPPTGATAAVGRVAGRADTRPLPVRPLQTSERAIFPEA